MKSFFQSTAAKQQELPANTSGESGEIDDRPTILIVDDEPGVLNALKRTLHQEPYRVLTTTDPMEAFHLLATQPVQMVISDQRMPEMTGTELLLQVKLLYPDVVRVILTGYTDEEAIMAAINDGQVYKFLFKPWNSEALKLELYHALKYQSALAASRENQDCQLVLERLPAPLLVVDAADRAVHCNLAAIKLFPSLQTHLAGEEIQAFLPDRVVTALSDARQNEKAFWHTDIHQNGASYRVTGTRLTLGSGSSKWVLLFQPLDLPS
jgi:response regulator RpfG family c-di-GMP phosphodiesterase